MVEHVLSRELSPLEDSVLDDFVDSDRLLVKRIEADGGNAASARYYTTNYYLEHGQIPCKYHVNTM